MGQSETVPDEAASIVLKNEDGTDLKLEEVIKSTHFTQPQILLLYRKYQDLTHGRSGGQIEEQDFIEKMGFANKKIGSLIYHMLDSDGSNSLSFVEFLFGLDSFLPQAPIDKKIELCFKAYDGDNSGAVSKEEIRDILDISINNNIYLELSEAQIQNLIDELFEKYDVSGEGEITFSEFREMVLNAPGIIECFNFNIDDLQDDEKNKVQS